MIKRLAFIGLLVCMALTVVAQRVSVVTGKKTTVREQYAKEYLQKKLTAMGYTIVQKNGDYQIALSCKHSGKAEGYQISRNHQKISIIGNDPSGVIYGCVELAERIRQGKDPIVDESPQMVMRGTCIGLQ